MAFALISGARHSLHPAQAGPLTTPQASLDATDRSVAPPYRAFDAGLRPDPFPDRAASLLPGLLAATRTGLTPASDDELPRATPISEGTGRWTSPRRHPGARPRRARNVPGIVNDDPDVPRDLHDPLPEPGPNDFIGEEHLALITALAKIFSGFDDTEGQDESWAGS